MASSTIQRNALVAPFSTNTPFIRKGKEKESPTVDIAHQRYFQQLQDGVNASVQITANVPANSNSPGQPGTIAFTATGLFLCVGVNTWIKFIGAPF